MGHRFRLVVAASALLIAGLFGPGGGAEAAPSYEQAHFNVATLFPNYAPLVHDYVVRCNDGPVTVYAHASGVWRVSIADGAFRSGDFYKVVSLGAGRAFTVTAKQEGLPELYRYHVRCLPNDFPRYTFTRYGPVSPQFFAASNFADFDKRYVMIFDNRGVPIWWYKAPTWDSKVLPSGNVLWSNRISNQFEIHRLDGSLVRTLGAVGHAANDHDLQFAPNGDHLVGSYVRRSHVDTSAYGGSQDATVVNTELQQVRPNGQLVWSWKSQNHISLAETPGYRWPWIIDHGYEVEHWNSIEPAGDSVIASFRHLDAVYKIRKSTGNIVWKLGGTSTPQSLEVRNDPRSYTFGAQHDARLLPDGTVTVFDNRTNRADRAPRAVRFRIDEQAGTATLVQSITDPAAPRSECCGSARRLGNGDWLIDWGKSGPIGGYEPDGQRTFLLTFDSTFAYRAAPVPSGAVAAQDLRQGMDAMYSAP